MGQTLTHGVYLPDEGERNCYNGLAANWSILDGAVGTVAEHTSQIAGKAPAVHTHTKSDITDFPALANVATSGSYNDLSNIPASFTPASHTHGNITNDGKVGTTAGLPLMTGTDGVIQAGAFGNAAGTICEGNDSRLSDARTPVAHTHGKADITDLFNSANTWTAEQIVLNNFYVVKENNYELGQSYPKGNHLSGLHIKDKNGATVGLLDIADRSYGHTEMRIRVQQKFDPNSNNRSTSGTILFNELTLGIASDKTNYIGFNADLWGANHNLGTSTYKWKTLNGINPGALSLPDYSKSMNVDTTGWSTSAGRISYTPTVNGWLQIAIPNDIDNNNEKSNFITIVDTDVPNDGFNNPSGISVGNTNDYRIQITFPVVANKTYYIYIKSYSGNILAVKYIAALGHI